MSASTRALVPAQELDDLLTNAGQVGTQLHEYLSGDTFAFADESEQDVLGADVVMAELKSFTERQLENLFCTWGEGNMARRRRPALADNFLNLITNCLERNRHALESFRSNSFALVNESEQDVLGADVGMIEKAGLLLREDDYPPGSVSEAFEHDPPFRSSFFLSSYRWLRASSRTKRR